MFEQGIADHKLDEGGHSLSTCAEPETGCENAVKSLSALWDRPLNDSEFELLALHLDECSACGSLFDDLSRLDAGPSDKLLA